MAIMNHDLLIFGKICLHENGYHTDFFNFLPKLRNKNSIVYYQLNQIFKFLANQG